MLKDFNLLNDHEVIVVRCHAKHHAVLHIQGDLACIPVLPARIHHTMLSVLLTMQFPQAWQHDACTKEH